MTQPRACQPYFWAKNGAIVAHQILQFDMLEILPDPLVRIEIGRIAGQSLQMDAMGTTCGEKVFNRLPTMNRGSIPHNQQLARNVSQDVLEKPHHVRATIG